MKQSIFLILIAFALAGCQAKVSNYERFLNSWLGKSEADLVATWGAPVNMQTIAPNRQIFTYIQEKQITVPAGQPDEQILGQNSLYNQNNDMSGSVYDYYCQTTFTTQDDIIVDYAWSGDACLMQ